MSHRLSLKLSNLYLDLKNPRYEEQRSQNEALNTIAGEQKGKLLVLLRDILENGLNPSDIPIVMPDPTKGSGYVVLEGNRRIAALKLYKKPSILTNDAMQQKYRKLHDEFKGKVFNNIDCLIVNSREEANLWIERKHEGEMNGAGTVKWNSVQSARFRSSKTGKDSRVLQLIDFMRTSSEGDAEFMEMLSKIKATNLERLMSTPSVCTELGLTYDNGEYASAYEWDEVLKGLKAIVRRLSDSSFSVKEIYTKKNREDYISRIPREELPDKSKKADSPWKMKDFKPASKQTGLGKQDEESPSTDSEDTNAQSEEQLQQERPTTRTTLLPETLTLAIPNDRVNRIYNEMKQLSHLTMPNTCAVMMRVFMELSVDSYLEEFNLLKGGALSAAKGAGDLKQKTNEVIHHLMNKKYIDDAKAKGIKSVINKDNTIFSVDTMNAYVHNVDFNPIPENLMLSWENIQPFIIALWKAMNDKKA